ncbi:TonB-dependent receptor [Haliea sp. E1-2-M8]|uniref:TonB-dependent receptor n=1 Tax=Haliea sp. E1-2-M8 TaxID=3064706 RepID=UPI0027166285|nr:TonB-dependent receptor [Haliea sp. E1-2-M8]MDO8863847.1 TonB-dependent receptor [Haliea sp. E1-2-M8]
MRTHIFCCVLLGAAANPFATAQDLEELLVSARHDSRTIDVTTALSVAPDAARLLYHAPGANVTSNGPLTGIPQYRGLFGPRIAVTMDGSQLAPAGPNWMDPPISYAVTAQLESLEVYRGIAPVSVAQESLGGAIDARTRRMDFGGSEDFHFEGRLVGSGQSINSGYQLDTDIQGSNEHHRFKLSAMLQDGDDAEFPGGEILPSRYQRERYDVGYGTRWGDHGLQLDYGHNDTGDAGTPALPMDISYFEGDLYKATYRYEPANTLQVVAATYASELDHGMSNFHLRPPPASALHRKNIATTRNRGFRLQVSKGDDRSLWRVGIDGFSEEHDSNIDNPNNPMFFVDNFNRAERRVLGAFVERGQSFNSRLRGEAGLRLNRARSDAGAVNATPAMMMPPAQALREAFNAADREQTDSNVDLVAKLNHHLGDTLVLYAGVAQKQRAPSYQERYLWLPLEATGGLADGQLYIGDIALDSERARTVELGVDHSSERMQLHPRVFYTRIHNYIQGTPLAEDHPATRMVRMMNATNGTQRPDPLRFGNVDAELYGFDMDWSWRASDRLEFSGLLNYVRGKRRDIHDDLYRIAPPNATLRTSLDLGSMSATLETVVYAAQRDVSKTNREQVSSGHGVVNLRGTWHVSPVLQLAVGAENLFDRKYAPHLGGYNRVSNPDVATGQRLPAQGMNLFARILYVF